MSVTVPYFINEIVSSRIKLQWLGLIEQGIVIGYFFACLLRLIVPPIKIPRDNEEYPYWYSIEGQNLNWRFVFIFPILPSIIQLIMLWFVFKNDAKTNFSRGETITGASMKMFDGLNKSHNLGKELILLPIVGQDSMDSASKSFISNKIYLLKSPLSSLNWDEVEFINEDVTYQKLITPKYKKILILGCFMAMFEQFSGINAINAYANYLGPKNNSMEGFRFPLSWLKVVVGFMSLYTLAMLKRRALFMNAFIISCLWNWILFQLQGQEVDEHDQYDHLIKTSMTVILFIFNIVYGLTLGPVTWSYMAEVLPARALGIAVFFHWIVNTFISVLPFIISANDRHYHSDFSYSKHYSVYFFCYSGLSMFGYFIVMVFMMETTNLYNKGYNKLYDHMNYSPMSNKSISDSRQSSTN